MSRSPINNRDCLPLPLSHDAALLVFIQHEHRRRQRIPTVTVLAGVDDSAVRLVGCWAARAKRPVFEASAATSAADAVECWFEALGMSRITTAAYAWLAARIDCDPRDLSLDLRTRSPTEWGMLLDRVLGSQPTSSKEIACRAVFASLIDDASTQALWHRLCAACDGDSLGATAAIIDLIGDDRVPILHVVNWCQDVFRLSTTIAQLASLASLAPGWPIIISADRECVERFISASPECRALALVREGLIWLASKEDDRLADDHNPMRESQQMAAAAARVQDPTDTHTSCSDAPEKDATPAVDDAARSEAERYLFERLQTHPVTAGLFELNASVGALDDGRALEVDLLSKVARVAVEIDGYYHFTDLEAYRRDRRKDMRLQQAGYFVIRCLAQDVTTRLEEILESIVAAVRRAPPGQGRGVL